MIEAVKPSTKTVVNKKIANQKYIEQGLEKFGLTKRQAQIYVLLVIHKEMRIQDIVKLTKIPRSSVYEDLKKLYEFGIAEEVIESSYKKIRPYSIVAIKNGLNERMLHLEKLSSDLGRLEKTINLVSANDPASTEVRYYRNRSGARQLYWNTLKAEGMVLVYSDFARYRYVGKEFYKKFVAESRDRDIKEKVLINPTPNILMSLGANNYTDSTTARTRLEDIRVIDKNLLSINGGTLIYNNVYAQAYLINLYIHGFEIESESFIETQRSIFNTFWNMAKPVLFYL